MTTRGRRSWSVTGRLRAIAGRFRRHDDPPVQHSRVHVASFEHTHRVWDPGDPPRSWFERKGITKWKG